MVFLNIYAVTPVPIFAGAIVQSLYFNVNWRGTGIYGSVKQGIIHPFDVLARK
jgi:hypothetical protein